MPGTLDQQIPDAKDRKTGFDQRQQFLIKNEKFADRQTTEGAELEDRPALGQPTPSQPTVQ